MDDKGYTVGEVVPDFTQLDSAGEPRRLSELAAIGRVVLLFYRGEW